jgi:hypothetical protein
MPYGIHGFCIRCPCVSGYTPLTKPSLINTNLNTYYHVKEHHYHLVCYPKLVFIPAFIVDYTAQEEEENPFNTIRME